ncbi:MAG: bacillithiol system redox-active protein YtxJ [Acidobacteriota bacterium]
MTEFQEIVSTVDLIELIRQSSQQPVLFFKHSDTCGISQRAFGEFERYLQSPESAAVRNCVIVIQTAREVSNELARLTAIQHESPQAILMRDGKVVWNDSHMALKSDNLKAAVSQR